MGRSNVAIRNAEIRDVSACCKLLEQLWPDTADSNPEASAPSVLLAYLLAAPTSYVVLVADEGDRLVGLLDASLRQTLFHSGLTMIIEDLIVDRGHRRQHFGQQLVRAAERVAQDRRCRAIELSSDLYREESHTFWEATGYKRLAYQFRKVFASNGGRE